jgi:hypothetical protein
MVYKKFIKRNGKLYGPYIYHSKRVDGRVVSEYRGAKDFSSYKKFVWIFFGFAFLILMAYGFSTMNKGISGMAVFDIDANYIEGKSLDGVLSFSLQEGELLPASTKVVFENVGQVYRFDLSEIVSDELVQGNYYVKGKSLGEEGWGYGVEGIKNIYPELTFTLDVYSIETGPISSEVLGDTLQENLEEIPVSNNSSEFIEEPILEETVSDEEELNDVESFYEDNFSESSLEESINESSLTENFVENLFEGVSNFFLRLTLTGKVVDEEIVEIKKIQGKVSGDKPFEYFLETGQSARILPGSVRLNSEKISEDRLNFKLKDNKVIITTDYANIEKGFGPEYLGKISKDIKINLTKMGLVFEPGELKINLVYEGEEIAFMKAYLSEGNIIFGENILSEIPETEIFIEGVLSEEERRILIEEFGNAPVSATKMEVFNERLIVRFELNDNWVEYSYDYFGEVTPEIESQIEFDRINWLKDLARKLSEN